MSFWRTYYHLVWATKKRAALLTADLERELYPYIVLKAHSLRMPVYAVNGHEDHIHVVGSIRPKDAVSNLIQTLKGASSHHITHTLQWDEEFAWQRGFGVFTLGQTQLKRAVEYVENQKQHHSNGTINQWLEEINQQDDPPTIEPLKPSGNAQPTWKIAEEKSAYTVTYNFP